MPTLKIRRAVIKWGNSFGLRLTRREVERLGIEAKREVLAELTPEPARANLDHIEALHLGRDASEGHDEILAEGFVAHRRH